jgi:hypothetical protein
LTDDAGCAFAIAEDEHCPDERIMVECFPAHPCQAINASAKISRLDGYQDLHRRRDL